MKIYAICLIIKPSSVAVVGNLHQSLLGNVNQLPLNSEQHEILRHTRLDTIYLFTTY